MRDIYEYAYGSRAKAFPPRSRTTGILDAVRHPDACDDFRLAEDEPWRLAGHGPRSAMKAHIRNTKRTPRR